MLKKLWIILLCGVMLLTGCDKELGAPEISITDITPKNGYNYADAEDCGDGCIYKAGTVMWYYDYKYKMSVPFCADPACKHDDKTCAAFLPGRVFGYKDKFVIAGNEWTDSENYIDKNVFVLEEFDISSQTKREVMRLDRCRWCDTYAYGDKLFIGLYEEYYLDGDYLFASSDRNRVYLMVVSLDTLEVEFITDCIMDAFNVDINFFGVKDGKMYFDITYHNEQTSQNIFGDYEEPDEEIEHEQFKKNMVYDIETKELSEFTGENARRYLNGCAVYPKGKTVTFDCGDKICELTSDYELFYGGPCFPLQYSNGKVYMEVFYIDTQARALFIFDTETEKLSSLNLPWNNGVKFVAERENEFLFANYETHSTDGYLLEPTKIITLPKSEYPVHEITPEQYNELCRQHYEAYKTEEEENADID